MRTCTIRFDDGSPCTRPLHARGMCETHWARDKHGRPMGVPVRPQAKRGHNTGQVCRFGCGRPAVVGGACRAHWRRHKKDPGQVSGPLQPRVTYAGAPQPPDPAQGALARWNHCALPEWVLEEMRREVEASGGRMRLATVARRWLTEVAERVRREREEAERQASLRRLEYGPQKRGPKPRRAA